MAIDQPRPQNDEDQDLEFPPELAQALDDLFPDRPITEEDKQSLRERLAREQRSS